MTHELGDKKVQSRLRARCLDDIEADLQLLRVRAWRCKAQDKLEWKDVLILYITEITSKKRR